MTDCSAAEAEPYESDVERDDDGLPETAPLPRRLERLKAIIEGAGATEAPTTPSRAERQALDLQRAERARRAARDVPLDEPRDVLGACDIAEHEAPWRESG